MSFAEHREHYFGLMRKYVDGDISPDTFVGEYFSLWKSDRDEEWAQTQQWERRYELELSEAFRSSRLSKDEFVKRRLKLFGSVPQEELIHSLIDRGLYRVRRVLPRRYSRPSLATRR